MYASLRNFLFQFDAEAVHHFAMNNLKRIHQLPFGKSYLEKSFVPQQPGLSRELWGLHFPNPVGLGAGFDKNAMYLHALQSLGFGFVEIGTVTPKPQEGNEQPRLFRLPQDKALINRMGFNNDGVQAIAKRLEKRPAGLIVGGNIGKNKVTPNEEAWKDYEICFRELFDFVDYFVVNVSSPNTPGLRALQEKGALLRILDHLQTINQGKQQPKPLLLKIAPDLTYEQLNDIIEITATTQLSGLVATNTTISREGLTTRNAAIEKIGAGGLSGKPVKEKSTEILRYLIANGPKDLPIIASGGIFTGKDAREKLQAGAKLVQVWTGFIYEGPSIVKNICTSLAK